LLEPASPHERGRAPEAEDVDHLARNVDPGFRGHLLGNQCHRKERREIVRADRFARRWVEGRLQRLGEVWRDVEPRLRHLIR
jgi:hypothetical protein